MATLTSKGQITIPVSVRNRLGLKPGDQIDFVPGPGGGFVLEPKRMRFEALHGLLKGAARKAVRVRAMDRAIGEAVVSRWRRGSRAGSR